MWIPRDCVREVAGQSLRPVQRRVANRYAANEVTLTIDSHPLKFTNLNKVFYPAEGIVKRDLLNYYDAVARASSCRTSKTARSR